MIELEMEEAARAASMSAVADPPPQYDLAVTMPRPRYGDVVRFKSDDPTSDVIFTFVMTDDVMCDPPKYCLFDSADGVYGTSFQPTPEASATLRVEAAGTQHAAGIPRFDNDALNALRNTSDHSK